jgi:hypothetical protein
MGGREPLEQSGFPHPGFTQNDQWSMILSDQSVEF